MEHALRRRIALVFLAAVIAAAGCARVGRPPEEPEEIPGEVPAPGDIRFSVRVTPLRFSHGQRVLLEASMFNDGEDTFKKKFPSTCVWDFEVFGGGDEPLCAPRVCEPRDSVLYMEPKELRMLVRQWAGRDRYFHTQAPLPVGRYRVVAGFLDTDGRVLPMSAPVEIEILATGKDR